MNGYLAIEDRLFQQLEQQIMERLPPAEQSPLSRYHRGSLTDPGRWDNNWNRTLPAVFTGLYNYLINTGNELVVFDINRHAGVDSLLVNDPLTRIQGMMAPGGKNYRLSLVTNENPQSKRVVVITNEDGKRVSPPFPLDCNWPEGLHSLSPLRRSIGFYQPGRSSLVPVEEHRPE